MRKLATIEHVKGSTHRENQGWCYAARIECGTKDNANSLARHVRCYSFEAESAANPAFITVYIGQDKYKNKRVFMTRLRQIVKLWRQEI